MTNTPRDFVPVPRETIIERKFYDQGWNDCVNGYSLERPHTKDYGDGWLDCNGSEPKDRTPMS